MEIINIVLVLLRGQKKVDQEIKVEVILEEAKTDIQKALENGDTQSMGKIFKELRRNKRS